MKIKLSAAVAFFVAVGFAKADKWTTDVLAERLGQVGDKVKEDKVPDDQKELYKQLVEAEDIELEDDRPKSESKEEGADVENMDEDELREHAKSLGIKGTGGMSEKVLRKAIEKASKGRKSAVDKAIDKKGDKGSKKKEAKPAKEEKPRDAFGSTEDSIRGKVNATLSEEFKSDKEIAEEAGVTLRQARIRLRRLTKNGVLEKESAIQYKLAKGWKKKLAEAKAKDNDDDDGEDDGDNDGGEE